MKGGQLRLLVVLGNVGLLAAIWLLAFQIWKGSPYPPEQTPNPKFDSRNYQVADNNGPRSSIQEYMAIWAAMDRALPPPAPVQQPVQQPVQPTVQSLASQLRVVAVYAADEPDKSTAIVEALGSGQQQMIKIGEKLQGYEVIAIRSEGETAVVTVRGPASTNEDIRLTK